MIEITKALPEDAEEIYAIYEQLKGSPGCTWNEEYPTLEFVRYDIVDRDSLYKAVEDGEIVAAAYLGDFEEVERPDCVDKSICRLGEFSRVGVKRSHQRRGIAETLLRFLLDEAYRLGYDGLTLLAGIENHAAMSLYEKLGFERRGETFLYETHWYCYVHTNIRKETDYDKEYDGLR